MKPAAIQARPKSGGGAMTAGRSFKSPIAFQHEIECVVASDQLDQFGRVDILGGFAGGDARDLLALLLGSARHGQKQGKCQLSFLQIRQRRFAEYLGAGGEVEQIVDQLETNAEVETVVEEGSGGAFRQIDKIRRNAATGAEERGRLTADDLEIVI